MLHLASLDGGAAGLAQAFRRGARQVDHAVDDLLVDLFVDERGGLGGAFAGLVDHLVDAVLVDPVGGIGHGPLGAPGDDVGVEVVEVVLVHQQGVAGLGQLVVAGGPVGEFGGGGALGLHPHEEVVVGGGDAGDGHERREDRQRVAGDAVFDRREVAGGGLDVVEEPLLPALVVAGDEPRRQVEEAGDDGHAAEDVQRDEDARTRLVGFVPMMIVVGMVVGVVGGVAVIVVVVHVLGTAPLAVERQVDAAGHVGTGQGRTDDAHHQGEHVGAVAAGATDEAPAAGAGEDLVL